MNFLKYFICKEKNLNNIKIFAFLSFIILFEYSECIDCPRDKPILKNNQCVSTYCGPTEFEDKNCIISNSFIKSQWLTKINVFNKNGISNICVISNSKNDLFLLVQEFSSGDKYIYGFSEDGNGLFLNQTDKNYYPFETIDFPPNIYTEIFHAVTIDKKEYLLSTQVYKEMYLIDYINKNYTIFKFNSFVPYSVNIFKLNGYIDEDIYLTSYIYCTKEYDFNDCNLGLRIFKLYDSEKLETLLENPDIIPINYKTRLSCFQNKDLYIQCIYNTIEKINQTEKYNHVIGLFNYKTLKIEYTEILDENFPTDGIFDSTIQLNENIFITGYSHPTKRNVIKLLFKKFEIKSDSEKEIIILEDYIRDIPEILINDDGKYVLEKGLLISRRNSMTKISETEFAILLNEFTDLEIGDNFNKNLLILIFRIFNNSNVSIRYYKIDFSLYNFIILEDVRGYTFNKFFGILLETAIHTNALYPKGIFVTFGYINSRLDNIPIDKNLKENNTNSVIILSDYISEIENNLFLYKFVGVKILKIPNLDECGYFINNSTNQVINEGDILNIDTVLRFILIKKEICGGELSLDFAGVAQEPDYDLMNINAEDVEIYPINDTELERKFYVPKTIIGRVIHYKFDLNCYDSCSTCYMLSNDPNDQKCEKCKDNYYFQNGTQNCFQSLEGYYLDNTIEKLLPCHPLCATCEGPPLNINHMNCLSCRDGFNKYQSNNCLNCSKYVNFELTKCIDEIPEGYFLLNADLGILGKCHNLCKTCFDYPDMYDMNCIECKYNNSKFKPEYEGECPPPEEEIILPEDECPRDKPILVKNKNCSLIYCNAEDYENKICIVNNSIVKEQWLNNIQNFGYGNIEKIDLDYGLDDELFLFAQKREINNNQNYIYGFDKNGNPFFSGENREKKFLKIIDFPNGLYLYNIKFVKNFENNKTFFISSQIENEMYQINYDDNTNFIHKFNYSSFSSDSIFTLKEYPKEYFTNYIYCENKDECYTYLRRFNFSKEESKIEITCEKVGQRKINPNMSFICFESYDDFIQCIFTEIEDNKNKYILGLFNSNSLSLLYSFTLEANFEESPFLDSMIKLNDDAFVIAYTKEKNVIKILLKIIKYNYLMEVPDLEDYIPNIPQILVNEDNYYILKDDNINRNSIVRINDNKFAMLLNIFNDLPEKSIHNPIILIYIFNIYNGHNFISTRKYSINFKLYNSFNYGNILGYNLGNFFGILIELSSPSYSEIVNSVFMTFGYINTVGNTSILDNDFIIENSNYSKFINFKNYIKELENNLFGYEFLGVIILSLPDENLGNFIKYPSEKIYINQTLTLDTEIKLKLNENYKSGIYSISFAGAAKEQDYEKMNTFAEETLFYPSDSKLTEKDFYTPKILIGRKFEYNFLIQEKDKDECYPSCLTCYTKTKDSENHQCIECKPGYYFKENSNNCYNEIDKYYFFDEDKQMFLSCYIDCLTCQGKQINETYMNCLSCEDNYKFYQQSTNCLNCPKYVNYLQTECIDKIPDGYYLSDENLGIIDKCYNLCKTCSKGPNYIGNTLYMNCDECLYSNENFVPTSPGECPSSSETHEDEFIDGECPRDKPILKENTCQAIYCTEEEFVKETCKIFNKYIKKQWLNNFHIFDEISTSYACYDINEQGDLFFIGQKEDEKYFKKYIYGFNSNGTGILYNKQTNNYESFKSVSYQLPNYIEKIKYIKIGKEEYLLNILKDKKVFLFNFNEELSTQLEIFDNSPYSFDAIIKLKGKEDIYFLDYIYCLEQYTYDNCYAKLLYYKVQSKYNFILESSNEEKSIQVVYKTKLTCVENSNYFIQCTYTTSNKNDEVINNQHILGLFNKNNLEFIHSFILENNFDIDASFDSMIELKDNVCVIAYSLDQNIIHTLFKKITLDKDKNYLLEDFIIDIPYININEDLIYQFKGGNAFRNNLFRINDEEFIMLINDFKNSIIYSNLNSKIVIIHFRVYNFDRNIIVRHYKIDFSLNNIYVDGDLLGYKLGGFLGALVELTSPEEKYMSRASFITFGYLNTTEDINEEEGTKNLIVDKKYIKINDYITGIENNLFGYEFIGVKILSLPDENKVGYFVNKKYYNKIIKVDDIIEIDSELSFVINDNPIGGNYSISFAGMVQEPEFFVANNFSILVENYPNTSTPEKFLNEQKILIGKEFSYKFTIKEKACFQNCEICNFPSLNINEQNCIKCKNGFYFKDGTKNCYDKIYYQYYFNKETNTFSPCYKECYTCNTKEINSTHMNCLTCFNSYKFYEKTTNCLNCPNYVNYLQTECINEIPEGYFLSDEIFRTIEKCHKSCKTCKAGPIEKNNKVYMNCEECLDKSQKLIGGNCQDENDSSSSPYLILISIILVLLIIVIILLILYIKYKNKNNKKYNYLEGKNIPFEDEYFNGIN